MEVTGMVYAGALVFIVLTVCTTTLVFFDKPYDGLMVLIANVGVLIGQVVTFRKVTTMHEAVVPRDEEEGGPE